MISIKTNDEIALLRKAGQLVAMTHSHLKPFIKEGITTNELDQLAYDFIVKNDSIPSFKGYSGFPKSICTSVNEVVVHGIPGNLKLKNGDVISIDIGVLYKGYHGDSAWTYPVGEIDDLKKHLLEHTEKALFKGLSRVKEGAHIGDIGFEINKYAKSKKLSVVKELVGHGVGSSLHEEPDIPNYGKENKGPALKEGMVLAIEPMLNLGTADIYILEDDWTIVTADEKASAHYEHTVLVTKDSYEILTKR